jgi:hypothetical protein
VGTPGRPGRGAARAANRAEQHAHLRRARRQGCVG